MAAIPEAVLPFCRIEMAHFSGSKPGEACQDILYLFKVACTITLAYRYVLGLLQVHMVQFLEV